MRVGSLMFYECVHFNRKPKYELVAINKMKLRVKALLLQAGSSLLDGPSQRLVCYVTLIKA
jgi:hypothetical protein